MKLIRCSIENFGKLENFQFSFEEGLTVLCRPNGFGKTTLAAFLKAMFYGLPKTGPRNAAENERRRYEPWQGGIYGGFLEFEFEGTPYRVTRHFGATAAKDRFSLMDLSTRKPSTRFSERLGEELFRLDAESFGRSVFLSSPDRAVSATTSIRAKLSDLVDDTNDLNNYDSAMELLKKAATEYRAQRGSGGRINELSQRIEALEEQKYAAEEKKPRLREAEENVRRLQRTLEEKNGSIRRLREQIQKASSEAARQAAKKQLRGLRRDLEEAELSLGQLAERYPGGLPSREEIQERRSDAAALRQAETRLGELTLSQADRALVETEQSWFSDPVATVRDIDACQGACSELDYASARLHAQMLPEELQRLEALSARFRGGAPDEGALAQMQARAEALRAKELRLEGSLLSEDTERRFSELQAFFAAGEPDDGEIELCEKQQQEIAGLEAEKKALSLTPEESERMGRLAGRFAEGIPEESEIAAQQQAQKRINELNGIKSAASPALPEEAAPAPAKAGKKPVLVGALGILLLLAGIACVFAVGIAPGIVFLTGGLVALIAAFWLHTQEMIHRQTGPRPADLGGGITEVQTRELYELRRGLNEFLLRFWEDASQPDQKLIQLLIDRKDYLDLREKKARLETALAEKEREIALRKQANLELFSRYYHDVPYWDGFTNDLMRRHSDYTNLAAGVKEQAQSRQRLSGEIAALEETLKRQLTDWGAETTEDLYGSLRRLWEEAGEYGRLRAKQEAMLQSGKELQARSVRLEEQIQRILTAYHANEGDGSCTERLQGLRKRFEAYQGALFRVGQYRKDRDDAQQRAKDAAAALRAFAERYQLSGGDPLEMIRQADDAVRRQAELEGLLQTARNRLAAFLAEAGELPGEEDAAEGDPPDLEALQRAETETQREMDILETQLREWRQEHDTLRRCVDELPDCLDQIAGLTEQRAEAQKAYGLLMQTQEYLRMAKDRLSRSYVGTVERGFRQYAEALMEGELAQVLVDNDLNLLIDEKGKAREAELFSTGTYECVMICMRMALIDALFTREQPFVLLDDPFVNLDDRHTELALDMVKKLAQKRQVVYLVCNSSRDC